MQLYALSSPLLSRWPLLIPLVLGALGVWLLLPQVRRRPFGIGIAAVSAALLSGVLVLVRGTGPTVPWEFDLLFYIFAGMAVVAGTCMIVQSNSVYAALWFAIAILSTCGLFLLQSAPFLAAATIIVYAGAIIVTFLFVIMLAQQSGMASYDRHSREPLLACVGAFVLLGALLWVLQAPGADATGAGPYRTRSTEIRLIRTRCTEAIAALELGATTETAGELLYLKPSTPDTGVAFVLYQLTETMRPAERDARRASLEPILTKLGTARTRGEAETMRAAIVELRGFTNDLEVRVLGSSLSRPAEGENVDHVAGLGTSLFGDYLWTVELAGSLLLIATIGAIAIANRRKEES